MLAPVACGVDDTTMSAPCPPGHLSRSVTETPVGSRRVERLAHGLPNQPSDMAARRLAVIDVRPESGAYATNLAKRGAPRLPSSIARRTAWSSCSRLSVCDVVNGEILPHEPGHVVQGNSVPHGRADCYGETNSLDMSRYRSSSCPMPPTRRTLPSSRRVAVWSPRGSERSGPGDHELVAGSKISVVE